MSVVPDGLARTAAKITDSEGAVELVDAKGGGITFEDVHFGYVPERDILKGLTLEVRGRVLCDG